MAGVAVRRKNVTAIQELQLVVVVVVLLLLLLRLMVRIWHKSCHPGQYSSKLKPHAPKSPNM